MGDLPGELGAVPLVDQPQVRGGVATPSRRLGFPIALKFVRFKRCLSLSSWFCNFQSELDKIVYAVVFGHLQKVTHRFCVPVVVCRPLHYHYLPWQVPGICILVMVVYVHARRV